jgi:hypothetical protein
MVLLVGRCPDRSRFEQCVDPLLQYFEELNYPSQLLSEDDIRADARHFAIFTSEKYMSLEHSFFDQILTRNDCLLPDNTHYLNFSRYEIHHGGDDSSLIVSKLNVTELIQLETQILRNPHCSTIQSHHFLPMVTFRRPRAIPTLKLLPDDDFPPCLHADAATMTAE